MNSKFKETIACFSCLFLLLKAPFAATLVATAITILVVYLLSKPLRGVGITLPAFIAPVVSVLSAPSLLKEDPILRKPGG